MGFRVAIAGVMLALFLSGLWPGIRGVVFRARCPALCGWLQAWKAARARQGS